MRSVLLVTILLAVTACGSRDEPRDLFNLRSDGPDEFAVTTNKPLEIPENLQTAELPTPGGDSRADINPQEQIAEALGGSATSGFNDQAFVNSASRFGVTENIRSVLAAEDEEFRANVFVRPLERVAQVNVYFEVYSDQSVDAYAELDRLRAQGVRTPTAPPPPED